jgi:DNA-binding LacI/PurR family transcriptional regulator
VVAVLPAQRRARILHLAQQQNAVRVVDLMTELGVSDATIRRDLQTLARQGLLDKVHGGATTTMAVPDERADLVRPDSSRPEIGVLIPSGTYYTSRILDGIRAAADAVQSPFTVNLVLSDGCADTEQTLITKLIDARVDGLLLMPTFAEDDRRRYGTWLRTLPIPVVLVERDLAGDPLGAISSVRAAHELGATAAVSYLHNLGHTQIALISRGSTQTFGLVRSGWDAAITRLDIAPRPPVIDDSTNSGSSHWEPAELDAVLETFRAKNVTAMLCHNDKDALSILQHAQSRGLSIPGDLSIIAYDDELASLASPPLTAVSPPKERIGAIAAATLRTIIDEGARAPIRQTHIEPELIVRSSTSRIN